ncbi:DUF362 domain-containing protein, partial [candidate division KSB1 bacterium]|nr:DUF362 domain-containing protein [candidate division KSB1 bacterium]
MRVSIIKAGSNRKQSLIEALDYLGGLDRFVLANDRIMLKPNLNGVEGCTDIALTEALLRLLLDKNARVVIAESTFGDAKMTDMFFLKSGYAELAKKYNVKLYNLNASQPIRVKVKNPQITDYLYLAREIFDTDKIINLPNLKVHYATGITLALKNLKGLLVGSEKKRFHDIGLDKAIVDLNNTIRPDLTIADAISCMEGMGPRGGDLVKMNLILAGQNSAA